MSLFHRLGRPPTFWRGLLGPTELRGLFPTFRMIINICSTTWSRLLDIFCRSFTIFCAFPFFSTYTGYVLNGWPSYGIWGPLLPPVKVYFTSDRSHQATIHRIIENLTPWASWHTECHKTRVGFYNLLMYTQTPPYYANAQLCTLTSHSVSFLTSCSCTIIFIGNERRKTLQISNIKCVLMY